MDFSFRVLGFSFRVQGYSFGWVRYSVSVFRLSGGRWVTVGVGLDEKYMEFRRVPLRVPLKGSFGIL